MQKNKNFSHEKSFDKGEENDRLSLKRFLALIRQSLEFYHKPISTARGFERSAPLLFLVIATAIFILPFINKAIHIDDPLFIWTAKNIQDNPLNPYGFHVNWYGTETAMSSVIKNPPGASYYIALAASLIGWSETALHIAFLLPALAVSIGTYFIAQRFCKRPLIAACAGIFTPVFFVSSLTVMSDILMLAFWLFAIHFWIEGIETNSHKSFIFASILIVLAALTKYFALVLIPLLVIYSIFRERRIGWWLLYFLIPFFMLAWYQWATHHLYGRGLLLDAATYAIRLDSDFGKISALKTLISFAFTGGCIACVLFFARWMWSRFAVFVGLFSTAVIAFVIYSSKTLGTFPLPADDTTRGLLAVQIGIWSITGMSLIVLSVLDFSQRKDSDSLLLFLWMFGTFLFAGFINWTTNGRSILPMIIPAGILIVRRIEQRQRRKNHYKISASFVPLMTSALISLAVTWADCKFADTARLGATKICKLYNDQNRAIWFEGHWGFQYYMEKFGAKALDRADLQFRQGDIIAVPTTNTNIYQMPGDYVNYHGSIDIPSTNWLSTMDFSIGAGFYADVYGPLPYVLGNVQMEKFMIYEVK